jgi:polyhydroxybutyrate depolymerase
VVSNPLAGWWDKNKTKVLVAGAAILVVFVFVSFGDSPKTERVAIPKGYPSVDRELLVHAPKDPKSPVPLVLVLSDDNMDVKTIERESKASKLADRRHFAVAYPEPVAGTWRVDDPSGADAQYLRDVVRYLAEKRTAVDPDRVYVWGLGEGARMALTVACANRPPVFAAVGVVGQFDPEPGPTCRDRVPEARVASTGWSNDVTTKLWNFSKNQRRKK